MTSIIRYIHRLLAWRFIRGAAHHPAVATIAYIALFSMALGTGALNLTLAIMNGYEQATYQTLQGIHPTIRIDAEGDFLDDERIGSVLAQEFPTIAHWAPQACHEVLIAPSTAKKPAIGNVVVVHGIDPERERLVRAGAPEPVLLANNAIVLGKALATTLLVKPGDFVTLFVPQEPATRGTKLSVSFEKTTVHVGGIIESGFDDIDSHVAFCALDLFKNLFPETGITSIGIRPAPDTNQTALMSALRTRLDLPVYAWHTLYPALVAAMRLEKLLSFLVICLITLVASMNIMSLLFTNVIRKQWDIAVLYAMGMQPRDITIIVLLMGTLLTGISALVGIICSWGIGTLMDHYQLISLPDVYYVTHVPVQCDLVTSASVFAFALLVSIVASWLPARASTKVSIAQVIRYG